MGVSFFVKKSQPVLIEDFTTGIGDWETYASSSGSSVSWLNGEYMRLRAQWGASTETYSTWKIGISGDYDLETTFINSNNTGTTRRFRVFMKADNEPDDINHEFIGIETRTDKAGLFHSFRYNAGFVNGPYVWNGKFRFTRTGDDYKTYYDNGSGWVLGQEITYSLWSTMYLMFVVDGYQLNFLQDIDSVIVNKGTIV